MVTLRRSLILFLILLVGHAHAEAEAKEPIRPLIVAHRCLLLHAPENTLANFRACLELRLGFEFDVARTKDGQLVCLHDSTVDRTTNGQGHVEQLTLGEIRKLDAGAWFDPRFAGERVPTVEEVLELIAAYRQHNVLVAVDLKAEDVGADVVRLAEKHKVLQRLLFIGRTISETKLRDQIRTVADEVQTAALANKAEELTQAIESKNADWVYLRFIPSHDQLLAIRHAKKRVFTAGPTVSGNVPDNWWQAAQVGSDAILTDYPLELRATLRKDAGK